MWSFYIVFLKIAQGLGLVFCSLLCVFFIGGGEKALMAIIKRGAVKAKTAVLVNVWMMGG